MVKIAQIGCGHWGKNLARNFAEIGALAAIVDGDPATAAAISAAHNVPASSFDAVLADPDIHGVALATPAPSHSAMALQAIAAGKHVFVEKPLALDPAEAEAMIAAAATADRRLMVGHLLQYHPVFQALKTEVSAGRIGALQYIYSNRMSLGKFRTEENILWSFAPHDFSMILSLTGEEPAHVTAQGASYVTPGVADWCTVQFAFPSGVRGHVQASWLHPFKEQRLVAIGDKGMLVFDDSAAEWEHKLAFYGHGIDSSGAAPVPQKADVEYLTVEKSEPLKAECQHFIDSIANGSTPRTDGAEGLRVLRALHRAEGELAKSLEGA
ncbi:MAG: Gfo/Idh/MocA family oxidoreductase [Parasphingorhabdus sp.]|nr:Gfo/Idh/MocA family oxidoreductase [Parasphingorhabdus sp.]